MHRIDALMEKLGVSFEDTSALELALVHSSYLNENPGVYPESNERLEFLGDALISVAVAHDLYRRFPDSPEGELTAMRSALVRGESLAKVAALLDLGSYLLMGTGEEAGGGGKRPSNLAAAFEALVGALLGDRGYDVARTFVLRVLSDELAAVSDSRAPSNPKSRLQELVQHGGVASPLYVVVEVSGQDHARQFTVEVSVSGQVKGRGTGPRKSIAEQEAAAEALKALGHAV